MIYLSVDRIEEDFAVCEDDTGEVIKIELSLLPHNIQETDVIRYESERYILDYEETNKRKKAAIKLRNSILGK